MTVAEMFSEFISNLRISNAETISLRYGEITAAINKCFRDTESKTANRLQVGSFGRNTAIDGVSDLDMLYIMPASSWSDYNDENGPERILNKTREAIRNRYPSTEVRVDRCVVAVSYADFDIEVQPVFEQDDMSYKYPDTYDKYWKITMPREEMDAIDNMDSNKNESLRNLCRMVRAWKNKQNFAIGGLLIDTLAYNFFKQTQEYDKISYSCYDLLSRDFFKYLSNEPKQDYYHAPGSNQRVKVKQAFQDVADDAYKLCLEAINVEKQKNVNEKWKKLYGRSFPANTDTSSSIVSRYNFKNTEEFIEDSYCVDIKYNLKINCDVSQNGFREHTLREMLRNFIPLLAKKELLFRVVKIDVPFPYQIKWKVLNRGEEAERRNNIRGQIVDDDGQQEKTEKTNFKGDHEVECYAIKGNVVVARDRILVPIKNNE